MTIPAEIVILDKDDMTLNLRKIAESLATGLAERYDVIDDDMHRLVHHAEVTKVLQSLLTDIFLTS